MNTFFSKIAIIVALLSYSHVLLAHVELNYPVGGETLTAGTTVTITWHIAIAHNTLNWDLYYSPDGGSNWEPIELGLPPSQLSYQWLVPSDATTQGRVRVFQNNSAQDYLDISGDFTIVLPSLLPTISLPAHDTTIQSDVLHQDDVIQAWLSNHGGASVNSSCTSLAWTNDFDGLSNGCGATGDALVTFTATDQCGSTETNALLTIVDNTIPTLSTPAVNHSVECNGNGNLSELSAWLISHGGAHAFDDGGNVTWTNNYSTLSNGCGTTGNTPVTFTVTDQCGNTIETTATFTFVDTTVPGIIEAPHDLIIDCEGHNNALTIQQWLADHGGASASDVCGNVVWTYTFPAISDTCAATGTHIITFTVSDECGNTTSSTATFTILGASGTYTPTSIDALIALYPNPVHDVLTFELKNSTSTLKSLTLFDVFGKSIWVSYDHATESLIHVSGYAPGMYFLQVKTLKNTFLQKIIIE